MNSMTSESASPKTKSLVFDVAEAEALMDEFGIVAPVSGLGSLQVIYTSFFVLFYKIIYLKQRVRNVFDLSKIKSKSAARQ